MYKYTSVPTSNPDQRWDHGIWVGMAPMTDEHISHGKWVPESEIVDGMTENWKATIVTQQDQGPSGHRRVHLTTEVAARHGATPGGSGCVGWTTHRSMPSAMGKALADERADPVEAPVGPIKEPATESQEPAPEAQQEPAGTTRTQRAQRRAAKRDANK